jgi:hypothetical protein
MGCGDSRESDAHNGLDISGDATTVTANVTKNNPLKVSNVSNADVFSFDPAPLPQFPMMGVKIEEFRIFVSRCGGKAKLRGLTTAAVCSRYVKSITAEADDDDGNYVNAGTDGSADGSAGGVRGGMSYCEMLSNEGGEGVGRATHFIR